MNFDEALGYRPRPPWQGISKRNVCPKGSCFSRVASLGGRGESGSVLCPTVATVLPCLRGEVVGG